MKFLSASLATSMVFGIAAIPTTVDASQIEPEFQVDTEGDGQRDNEGSTNSDTDPALSTEETDNLTDGNELPELDPELINNVENLHTEKPRNYTSEEEFYQMDTDGDGLRDINEMLILNPMEIDSDNDGVQDGNEDTDGDGLTNIEEQFLKTKIDMEDSDGDGLKDNEEITKYKTDPTLPDSDKDRLKDGIEVLELGLDPNEPDENNNGILDGEEPREYTFPKNKFGITGEMIGISDVPSKVIVRDTPILLIDQIDAISKFDIMSLDPNIEFKVSIPFQSDSNEDLELYVYDKTNANIIPVKNQKIDKKSNIIEAEFTGGGTYIVLSKKIWKQSLRPEKAKKEKSKKFKGKAKINGLPNMQIDGDDITSDGVFKIEKKIKVKQVKSLDEKTSLEPDEITLEAFYQVNDVYENDGERYLTASAVSTESGRQPMILVHGLTGGGGTWGFDNKWAHNFQSSPYATDYISGNETFSGHTYYANSSSNYSNVDVHYITGISDYEQLGPKLISNYGYTANEDLFLFIYNASGFDGCVRNAAYYLDDVIDTLQDDGIIQDPYNDVNLVAHSMGGLVSRYMIENISYTDTDRLITIGTPHYGSDKATAGDLDREDSELWSGGRYTLSNDNGNNIYVGFAGWDPSYGTLVDGSYDARGIYATTYGIPHYSSGWGTINDWDEYVETKYYDKFGEDHGYSDVEDGWVNIDSAWGSDQDPDADYGEDNVPMVRRFMVWHNVYGQHSDMKKYDELIYYVHLSALGNYDGGSED